jgi:hypothetical protein
VPDANPQHGIAQGSPTIAKQQEMDMKMNNNNASKNSILIQRMTTTIGERVL